jgi:glycosyltransferase involved in cell wall biosynthesis
MEIVCLNSKYSTTRSLIKCDKSNQVPSIPNRVDGGLRKAHLWKAASDSNPLVTIITVTFNGAQFLEQTIRSVLELAYSNIEYIIIDGGSKDGTVDILLKYNEQIDYWVSEPDEGIYDAMNKGWSLANEQSFILYLGAGDTIKSLPANMNTYKSDEIIYGNVMLSPTKVFLSKADSRLCFRNTLHHQALLINKSIHPEPPFNKCFKINADFDFNQRLFKIKYKFIKAENFLSCALPHGISGTYHLMEAFYIVKKNYGIFHAILAVMFSLFFIPRIIVYPLVKTQKPPDLRK